MSALFYAVVQALNALCKFTGLTYDALNILIYSGFIPASWWLILWIRSRAWPVAGLIHLGGIGWFIARKTELRAISARFYDANTEALLWLGQGTDAGYIRISILAGIVAPALIYISLFYSPKRALKAVYLTLLTLNALWYTWVLTLF